MKSLFLQQFTFHPVSGAGIGIRRLCIGAVIAQLLLVALGAASFDWEGRGRLGAALEVYGLASGAGYSYGFFAPGVMGQLRVLVDLQDARGRVRTVGLETGASHEADVRVGDIIDQFSSREANEPIEDRERFQRSLAASLALTAFSRHPDAKLVTIRLEHFTSMSMKDYRNDLRPEWKPVYQATFKYPGSGREESHESSL